MLMRRLNPQRQCGLSLVELMVALLLGSLLTLGATQVFLSSNTTYNLTDGIARIQENARFASSFLARDIREAGGNGCLPSRNIDGFGAQITDIRQNIQAPNLVGQGIVGWEANGTGPGDSLQLPEDNDNGELPLGNNSWGNATGLSLPASVTGNIVAGTDAFMIEGAKTDDLNGNTVEDTSGVSINLSGDSGINQRSVLLVVSGDCTTAIRFHSGTASQGSAITAMGGINQSGGDTPNITDPPMDNDLSIAVFKSSLYYIGNGVNGPALFRQSLEDDTASAQPAQEILGGVENMQLLYSTGGGYVTANNITNWSQVQSVRLAILMRSENNARDQAEQRSFNLLGTAATSPTDRRTRMQSTHTIALRNRLQ